MELILTGEIKATKEYDHIVDLDRLEFVDKKNKFDVYIEIPRLEGKGSFVDDTSITVSICDDFEKKASKNTKMVFNTILYMIRKSEDKKKNIVQFSAGGISLRLMTTAKKIPFNLRGNRNFKVFVS